MIWLLLILTFNVAADGYWSDGQYICADCVQDESYDRMEDFGGWVDQDGDCQNSRVEALISQGKVANTAECNVKFGEFYLPYSGTTVTNSGSIDIDHIVPLKHAWIHGARYWSKERRVEFANDPENLLISGARENRSKGWKSPEDWMPPNTKYHCTYILKWVHIKHKYDLGFSNVERSFIDSELKKCEIAN